MPSYSASISAQNPGLALAAQQLQQKIQRLNSLSSQSSSSDADNTDEEEVNDRFERALRFAQWTRSQEDGRWQAPAAASETLKHLVASAQ